MKKCPNCGSGYGEFDMFCAKCGYKLNSQESKEGNEIELLKRAALSNAKEFYEERERNAASPKREFFNSSTGKFTDSGIFNFTVCILIAACALALFLCFNLEKQKAKKAQLAFRNLISNPSQIPVLKEPQDIKEFERTIGSVNDFLKLYLKFSTDSQEKKEQVFASYLKEMEKLPHLTNDDLIRDDLDTCSLISTSKRAKYCTEKFERDFKHIGVKAFSNNNIVYFYPDYEFINKTYSKYLSRPVKEYLTLKAKYNVPVAIELDLKMKPKKLADKISDFEKLYLLTSDLFVKEECEKIIFDDFRKFIFTPAIYDTTTHEMAPEFKNAYKYFISSNRRSSLTPVIMSYVDKKRAYDEDNFKNDYPYKIFEIIPAEDIEKVAFSDVFVQLRKNIFSDNSKTGFSYTYNATNGSWAPYEENAPLTRSQYVISEPDENKNVGIYNSALALVQEINISKFSRLFFYKQSLYIFNADKLSISKIQFNGRQFSLLDLSFSDVTSLFPGVEIISIDSYSNYNIQIEKDNQKATYIVMTRYSRGYSQYSLSAIKGSITPLVLPNMFSVNSQEDVIVSYHGDDVNPEGTSESVPTYKFVIHTKGHVEQEPEETETFTNYDEQTAAQEKNIKHEPNIMPKILSNPPEQKIEPPTED